jgi:peroxiredoxin
MLASSFSAVAQHDFTFKIDGLSDTTVYLANYFGGKLYYNDTAQVDVNGVAHFKGEDTKPGGIYAVIFPDNQNYFQVVVNEPVINMETRLVNPEGNMNVITSEENIAFYEYLNFVMEVQSKLGLFKSEKEVADEKDKAKVDEKIKKEQARAETFKANFLKKNASLLSIKILKASDEVTVPEFKNEDGSSDDTKRFAYYHSHYFDNIDLTDDRMIRTPIINKKIETYLTKLTVQTPDSICNAIQFLTNQTADSSLMFKYIVQFSTNHFEKSEIMGMDAVFICISENYYAKGKAWWLNETQYEDIMKMYNTRKNLVVGKKAEDIRLMDVDSNWRSLHKVEAKYTVVVFWSPTCGHCKKELPKLDTFYKEWKSKGVEVFSVSTEFDNAEWPAFIKEHGFTWIDVSDNPEINENAGVLIQSGMTTLNSLNFRDYWDIYATPQYYLLDENKMIIAKRLNPEQLPDFIEMYEKRKEEENKTK